MGVTLHPPGNPKRLRISRTWKNQAFQVYVPIGGNLEKARSIAEELDEKLAQRQRAYQLRLELEGLHIMHPDGRIIGLQRQTRIREGRKPADSLKIRMVKEGEKPIFKAYSVDLHGFDKAFQMSVDYIADQKNVERDSSVYKKMLAAKTIYAAMVPSVKAEATEQGEEEHDDLRLMLEQEVRAFQDKRQVRIIRG